jgi:hypothetical protein
VDKNLALTDQATMGVAATPTLMSDSAYGVWRPSSPSDLQNAIESLTTSAVLYQRAENYYEGTVPEFFASIRLRRAMARTGVGFRFNFAKTPVDAVVDRLEINAVSATDENSNARIEDMWRDNQLDLEAPHIMLKACEYGDAYVIVWPTAPDGADDFEGDGSPQLLDTDADGFLNVDIFYNSPHCCRVFYDPERPLRKRYAVKKWILNNTQQVRIDLYYPDRIERFISKEGVTNVEATDMHPYRDNPGDEWPLVNPFNEVPVFHFRAASRPYGKPEHLSAFGPQDAIHKLILSHMAGVDYQAFPQRYALTAPDTDTADAVNSDEDEFSFALDTGATSRPSDPQSQLTSDPGSLWYMQGVTEVGQFAEANPETFMGPLQVYLRAMAQLCVTPFHYFDPSGDAPSGESLRTAEGPFVKKIVNRQLSFGATWREIFEFALRITGVPDPKVTVHWKSPASVDDLTGWQTVQAKLDAGVPPAQAFQEAGYTKDQTDEWFGDNDDDLPFRVHLLSEIAVALQGLSAAASTGIVDEGQVQELISSIIGEPELMGPDTGTA